MTIAVEARREGVAVVVRVSRALSPLEARALAVQILGASLEAERAAIFGIAHPRCEAKTANGHQCRRRGSSKRDGRSVCMVHRERGLFV